MNTQNNLFAELYEHVCGCNEIALTHQIKYLTDDPMVSGGGTCVFGVGWCVRVFVVCVREDVCICIDT